MEDLRVLEQQQRESQRLLASTKQTKKHRLDHRIALENKLSSLKYSNGESKQQLLRSREVLSRITRELGEARLRGGNYNDNLKRFDERLKKLLPVDPGGAVKAHDIGSALFSVPDAIRSLEWLHENGRCLDEIQGGPSTVRSAGRGAFARRVLTKGEVVTSSPLMHISREDTEVLEKRKDGRIIKVGDQLLLNYCFGHPNSTLLLYPYSSIILYINHNGGDAANARLQWSAMNLHKSEWLHRSVTDVLFEEHTGLIIDIVATRDIQVGEEIFLDYGIHWENAWRDHVRRWRKRKQNYIYSFELQSTQTVRTVFEQNDDPYPSNIMTVCFVPKDISMSESTLNSSDWYEIPNLLYFGDNALPCEITERLVQEDDPGGLYTAEVQFSENKILVSKIPRKFIHFVDKAYTTDESLKSTFRHAIGVPDDFFPDEWMDLM